MLKHVDLCSGIGGFAYGLQEICGGFETVAFCENDPDCQAVLKKNFPGVPVHESIESFPWYRYQDADIISAGFPCQVFSIAGKQNTENDERYIWPEVRGVIENIRPRWFIGENVVGIVKLALDAVLFDLERIGYAVQAFNIPACAVNGKHRRARIWIIAHDKRDGRDKPQVSAQ